MLVCVRVFVCVCARALGCILVGVVGKRLRDWYLQPKHRDATRVARSFFGEHASQRQSRQRCAGHR